MQCMDLTGLLRRLTASSCHIGSECMSLRCTAWSQSAAACTQMLLLLPGLMLALQTPGTLLMQGAVVYHVQGGLRDDTSLVIIDLLPPGLEFPQVCNNKRRSKSMSQRQMSRAMSGVLRRTPSQIPQKPQQRQKAGFCCFAYVQRLVYASARPSQLLSSDAL